MHSQRQLVPDGRTAQLAKFGFSDCVRPVPAAGLAAPARRAFNWHSYSHHLCAAVWRAAAWRGVFAGRHRRFRRETRLRRQLARPSTPPEQATATW